MIRFASQIPISQNLMERPGDVALTRMSVHSTDSNFPPLLFNSGIDDNLNIVSRFLNSACVERDVPKKSKENPGCNIDVPCLSSPTCSSLPHTPILVIISPVVIIHTESLKA